MQRSLAFKKLGFFVIGSNRYYCHGCNLRSYLKIKLHCSPSIKKENTAETVLVPIGGEIGIRTLAGPEAHYRFSRPTPSATWVFLRLCLVLPAGLEPAT